MFLVNPIDLFVVRNIVPIISIHEIVKSQSTLLIIPPSKGINKGHL